MYVGQTLGKERFMTPFQGLLLDFLQEGIEIVPRPFEALANRLSVCESEILTQTHYLKEEGIIRRFRGQINYRALGRVATLVTAQALPDRLDETAGAINDLPGVSHNYLRDHNYNLWFTLQDCSMERIDAILSDLSKRLGVEFRSLPAERVFKLDVRFQSRPDLPDFQPPARVFSPAFAVELSEPQKMALRFLQQEFPLVFRPFERAEGLEEQACLEAAKTLVEKGVLKRIAAVANHYKLGYSANGMFCAAVPSDRIESVGRRLAAYRQISHCYQRRPFAGWPYNLFAMIHARNDAMLRMWTEDFAHTMKINDFVVLRTVREFKKEPVLITFV